MVSAKVIFATITGNNEDIADIITEAFENLGATVEMEEISQSDASDLTNFDISVVVPYTYDEGSLPDEGMDFYEDLQELDLTGKLFGVAGSGDTFYGEFFGTAVDKFGTAFEEAGATKGSANLKIDLAPEEEDITKLEAFAKELFHKVTSSEN
ncbi:flavodoxin [Dellaglioa sp. P0083]|uniref:flavodoxin n=1 Tax=Dellaglioa kimchii TaxID=3344667 RepID=UPI0038D4BCA1